MARISTAWRLAFVAGAALLLAGACQQGAGPEPPPRASSVAATATPEPLVLQPCSAAGSISRLDPAPPTPTPSAPAAAATPPAGAPSATPTPRPAPATDRVGYPEGYLDTYNLLFSYDRADNRQVRVICGNAEASAAPADGPFPYGSILVMETYRTRQDAQGQPLKDERGRWVRDALQGVFVMRKEPGFGEAYGDVRTGEWEYVAFRPDKSYQTTSQASGACAACHSGLRETPSADWVFARDLISARDKVESARAHAIPDRTVITASMAFGPNAITVPVGASVTWTNKDTLTHTATSADGKFDSGAIRAGGSFSFTFAEPGTYQYVCSLHPEQMRARVTVQ